jgi:diacylglycerol kinase family enzyme
MWWMFKARFGRHARDPRLVYRAASSVRIESRAGPAPCQIDGEAAGFVGDGRERPALDIILRASALRVLIPPK